jgi:hypothetical protein
MPAKTDARPKSRDNDYKEAVQPIVEEALAPHNLARAIQTAITENKPLNDALQNVIKESVERNPDVQKALDKAISDSNAIKKSKLDYKQPGFWIPIGVTILGMVVSALVAILK